MKGQTARALVVVVVVAAGLVAVVALAPHVLEVHRDLSFVLATVPDCQSLLVGNCLQSPENRAGVLKRNRQLAFCKSFSCQFFMPRQSDCPEDVFASGSSAPQ